MNTDTRAPPSTATIAYFKSRVGAYHKAKTDGGRSNASADIERYLNHYKDLEQYDTRNTMNTDKTKNYIEIKVGGVVLRKQADKMTVKMDHTMEYSVPSIEAFRQELDAALDVIATAAKYDNKAAAQELI